MSATDNRKLSFIEEIKKSKLHYLKIETELKRKKLILVSLKKKANESE